VNSQLSIFVGSQRSKTRDTQELPTSSRRHQAVSCNITCISLYIESVSEISPDLPTGFALKISHPNTWIILLITPSIKPSYLPYLRRQPTRWTAYPFIHPTLDVNVHGGLRIFLSTLPQTSTYMVDCVSFST